MVSFLLDPGSASCCEKTKTEEKIVLKDNIMKWEQHNNEKIKNEFPVTEDEKSLTLDDKSSGCKGENTTIKNKSAINTSYIYNERTNTAQVTEELPLTSLVHQYLVPALNGTSLATNTNILTIIATYLGSTHMPKQPVLLSNENCSMECYLSTDERTLLGQNSWMGHLIAIWDMSSGRITGGVLDEKYWFKYIDYSSTQGFLITYAVIISTRHRFIQIWDTHSGGKAVCLKSIDRPKKEEFRAGRIISEDGVAIFVDSTSICQWLWKLDRFEVIHAEENYIKEAVFSRDNQILVLRCSENQDVDVMTLVVWDTVNMRCIKIINTNARIGAVTISAQHQLVGFAEGPMGYETMKIRSWATDEEQILCHPVKIQSCTFSSDTAFLAATHYTEYAGCIGNQITLWRVKTGEVVMRLYPDRAMKCTFFAHNSLLMVTHHLHTKVLPVFDISSIYYNDEKKTKRELFRTLIQRAYMRRCVKKLKEQKIMK